MIEVKNLNKSFANNQILFDVSSKFESGKVNLIIGQSGQGKSVLAKCMVGLHNPDTGSVLFNERDFCKMSLLEKKKLEKK